MADPLQMVTISLPADKAVLRGVASILERQQAWWSLATVLEAWQSLEPDNLRLRARQHDVLSAAGELERADACIRTSAHDFAKNRGAILRLRRLLQDGGHDRAVALLLRESVKRAPTDWRLALDLAAALQPGPERDDVLATTFAGPSQTSPVRAAILRKLLSEDRRDEARNALAALFSAAQGDSSRISAARRAAVEQLLEAGEDELVDAALSAYARSAPAALSTYLASQHGLPFQGRLRGALDRLRAKGMETVPFELAMLRALEQQGRHAEVDRLHSVLEGRLAIEADPSEPSPTPSTMMFRNRPLLDALVGAVGWFATRRGRVRVHVAACSSGEEAYSLAVALHRAGLLDRCDVSASDVESELVRRARSGVVDKKSLQSVPEDALELFEPRSDGRFMLSPSILGRIEFSLHDLLREPDEGIEYDIFIANNVLVHFPCEARRRMVKYIASQVAADGLICLGGGRQDDLEGEIQALGLAPVVAGSTTIFDAWQIQRNGWYMNPRPYWALPPARLTADCPWKHATLFARSRETAAALEALSADAA